MHLTAMSTIPPSLFAEADYAWEVATLFPVQGEWSEEEYLNLTQAIGTLSTANSIVVSRRRRHC
jgi:hypothetical protein